MLVQGIRIENETAVVLCSSHDAAIVVIAEAIELLRICDRQRLQHHRIDEREDRRRCSDAQGQGEHNDHSEAGRLPKPAQSAPQVLTTDFKERFPPGGMDDLPRYISIAML